MTVSGNVMFTALSGPSADDGSRDPGIAIVKLPAGGVNLFNHALIRETLHGHRYDSGCR